MTGREAHPPIFARVLAERTNPDVIEASFDPGPLLFVRGLAAYLSLAESISGQNIDGATYRLLVERERLDYARQAAARIIRGHPHGANLTYYHPFESRNKESS